MKLFSKKINRMNRGFTLVETLVAIAIFTVSILALLVILSQSITSTYYARQKMIASYLAQEGVEYIRNLRDTYVLYSTTTQAGWDAFAARLTAASCQSTGFGCYFDDTNVTAGDTNKPMENLVLTPCNTSNTCPNGALFYNSATGKYGNSASGVNSGFVRKITMTPIGSPANEIVITSTVYYTQGSGNYNVVFSESLFNWVE